MSNATFAPASITRRLMLLAALILGALLLPRPALAAGTVTLANREPTENDGRWKIAMTINYGGIPHLPHVPMIFQFTPTVLYERALTDQSPKEPVLIKKPLTNQSPINESLDVGFSDASGKVFSTTKFDFVIKRDHGFEAGEYDLKIKRQDDGVQMGQTIKLVLKGDNPVIDRRAIVFAGEKKKEKKAEGDAKAEEKPAADEKKDGEATADAPAEPATDAKPVEAPPPVAPKQGGCGCRVAGEPDGNGAAAFVAIALGAGVAARRRRARG